MTNSENIALYFIILYSSFSIFLARTIADLAGSAPIDAAHIAEALRYRRQAAA